MLYVRPDEHVMGGRLLTIRTGLGRRAAACAVEHLATIATQAELLADYAGRLLEHARIASDLLPASSGLQLTPVELEALQRRVDQHRADATEAREKLALAKQPTKRRTE